MDRKDQTEHRPPEDYGIEDRFTRALATQITRLLNESDVYNCRFTTQSGGMYSLHRYNSGDYGSEQISQPDIWLSDVRGSFLSGHTLAARGIG